MWNPINIPVWLLGSMLKRVFLCAARRHFIQHEAEMRKVMPSLILDSEVITMQLSFSYLCNAIRKNELHGFLKMSLFFLLLLLLLFFFVFFCQMIQTTVDKGDSISVFAIQLSPVRAKHLLVYWPERLTATSWWKTGLQHVWRRHTLHAVLWPVLPFEVKWFTLFGSSFTVLLSISFKSARRMRTPISLAWRILSRIVTAVGERFWNWAG